MEKIIGHIGVKTTTTQTRGPASTTRTDNPDVSSKWDKVASKEKREGNDARENAFAVGQTPPKKDFSVGAKRRSDNQINSKKLSSPFDLFNSAGDEEGALTGLKKGLSELDEVGKSPIDTLDGGDIDFFVDGETLDMSAVGMVTEKKEDRSDFLYENSSLLAANVSPIQTFSLQDISAEVGAPKSEVKTSPLMDELAVKLIDEITLTKVDGYTDTTITLKEAGVFSGAQVTLTEYDTTRREFNIRFENLNNQAHEILSMRMNQESLKFALEQKGYNVHVITVTTEINPAQQTYQGSQDRSGSGKQQPDQQNHQEQQQKKK